MKTDTYLIRIYELNMNMNMNMIWNWIRNLDFELELNFKMLKNSSNWF